MIRESELWPMLLEVLDDDEWRSLTEIYESIAKNLGPDQIEDSTRWKRNVRNVLQRRKASGEVCWDGSGGYMLPAIHGK